MSRFHRGSPGLLVAVVAVVVLGLTGCGQSEPTATKATGEKSSGEKSAASTEKPAAKTNEGSPTAQLAKAAKATSEHDSYKMRMVITADGKPGMDMTTHTSADGKRQRSVIKNPQIGEMTMLLVDGAFYYEFPGLPDGKQWVKMDSAEAMGSMGIDPDAMAEQNSNVIGMLNNLSEDVKVVGEETIEGMKSVHYSYRFDIKKLMQDALDSGALDGQAAEAAEKFGGDSEMNVWVGEDGLIRRVAYDLKTGSKTPGMPASMSYEMTFSDYGAPVDATAPDPAVTMSMSELGAVGS